MATQSAPKNGVLAFIGRMVDGQYLEPIGAGGSTSTDSEYTQADPQPGIVTAADGQRLVPVVSGGQGSETVTLRVQRSGFADRVGASYSLDGGTTRRGWQEAKWNGFDDVTWTNASNYELQDLVLIPSTQKLVCVYAVNGSGSVLCKVRDADGWGASATVTTTSATLLALYLTPDGTRLILVMADGSGDLSTLYSDDEGATWDTLARAADVGYAIDATANGEASGCFIGQDMVLLYRDSPGATEDWHQLASSDYGMSWVEVGSTSGALLPLHVAVTTGGGRSYAVEATPNSAPDTLTVYTMSSAYTLWNEGTPVEAHSVTSVVNELHWPAIYADQSGTLYLAWVRYELVGGLDEVRITISEDNGLTWATGKDVFPGVGSLNPGYLHMAAQFGEVHLTCKASEASGSGFGGSVGDIKVTRWSTVEWQGEPVACYYPLVVPDTLDANWSQLGTTAGTITAGELRISTAAASGYYQYEYTGHSFNCAANFIIECTSGGSVTTNNSVAILKGTSAGASYLMVIRLDPSNTQFRVVDGSSGATIETVAYDPSEYIEFMMLFNGAGAGRLFYKRPLEYDWTESSAVGAHSFTDDGAPGHNWRFTFGTITAATANTHLQWAALYDAKGNVLTGTSQLGRKLTAQPYPLAGVIDDDGNYGHLSIRGGLGVSGESYEIAPRYTYALTNALPGVSPSPYAAEWRSQDTSEQRIVWDLNRKFHVGEGMGLYIERANFRTAYLEYYNGSSWVTAGTWDARIGSSLTYDLDGAAVTPRSGTGVSPRPIHEMELFQTEGWVTVDTAHRYVFDNSGGWWTDVAGTTRCRINLKNVTGTETAAGGLSIYSGSGVMICYPSGTTTPIARYWRVRIPTQDCPDSYFKAGVIGVGRLIVFPQEWDWGWSRTAEGRYESFEDRAGAETRTQLGTGLSETWTVDCSSGVPSIDYWADDEAPYIGVINGGGSRELAPKGSNLWHLRGLLSRTRNQTLPVVAISQIPAGGSGGTVTDPTRYLYSYMSSSLASNQPVGTEASDQVDRIESIRFDRVTG